MNKKELKRYRAKFVTYLESLGFPKSDAKAEADAYIKKVGIDKLGHPIDDADICLELYYQEIKMKELEKRVDDLLNIIKEYIKKG